MSERIIKAQEQERTRIARDLHDQLSSTLAVIKMQMQHFEKNNSQVQQTIALIDKASSDVRDIAHNLMPADFTETNLHTVIDSLFYRLNLEPSIKFTFYHTEPPIPLPKEFELVIFRITSELVTNIVKHSNATEASLQLLYYKKELEVLVEDNGIGFEVYGKSGLGLKSICSRVKYLKGKLHIDSGARGTTIVITLPYE